MMTFSEALSEIKNGHCITRASWNGAGMFVFLVPGSVFYADRDPWKSIFREGTEINYGAHINMKCVDDQIIPWLPSQTDLLAEDWEVPVGGRKQDNYHHDW